MKFISKIFFASLFFIYSGLIFGQSFRTALSIKTDVDSSLIFINNNFVAHGNYSGNLAKGKYRIKVTLDSLQWNSPHFIDSVNVYDDKPVNLTYNFRKSIYLETKPANAYVYQKDSLIGYTPLFLKPGFNSLKLKKKGYSEKQISLNSMKPVNVVNLNYIGKPNGKSFYEKDIFKVLVGSIVVLGGTTAYFKLKADNRFSDYESTGNDQALKETRKLDLISGITMGLLQINFGILLYYFLTN